MATPNDTTANHGYQLWADGQVDWEHRTDMTALDTDVEIRDTDANKGNYTPKSGALYRATDTGTVYLGDGSSWVEQGALGAGAPGDASYLTTQSESELSNEQAVSAYPFATADLAAQAVTTTEIDGSGGADGDVLQTDGTAAGVSWGSVSTTGSGAWTSETNDGASLPAQDLTTVTGTDGVVYHHDGSSSITANGASTSAPGYYVWSATDNEWKTMVAY